MPNQPSDQPTGPLLHLGSVHLVLSFDLDSEKPDVEAHVSVDTEQAEPLAVLDLLAAGLENTARNIRDRITAEQARRAGSN